MKKTNTLPTYILSGSLAALSGAIIYFSYIFSGLVTDLPQVLIKVSAVLAQSNTITDEVQKIRQTIPSILEESERIRTEISPYPDLLKEGFKTVDKVLPEIEKSRKTLNTLTSEIQQTREQLPTLLKSANNLVGHAEEVGEKVSQGAAIGVVKGVIESPFALVDDLAHKLFHTNKDDADKKTKGDFHHIEQAALKACNTHQVGVTIPWQNTVTFHHGTVILKKIADDEQAECRTIQILSSATELKISNDMITYCRIPGKPWHLDG